MVVDFAAFNLILDDLVFPDGRTCMGVLGGGGPQTAYGMRLWTDSVGLVSGVGGDLPEEARQWLDECGIDSAGLRFSDLPTLRAWQLLEADGRRTQVWRVPPQVIAAQLHRSVENLPAVYRTARGFHLGVHPLESERTFCGLGGLVSIELFRPAERALSADELERLVNAGDIFSPNEEEAVSLVGPGDPLEQVQKLLQQGTPGGARVIVLRMGALGSLVARQNTRKAAFIPAAPVRVVDPVGAGNAYCGGFLVGWAQTGDEVEAGLMGAASASFLVEQVGCPPRLDAAVRAEACRRMEIARAGVQWLVLG
jgi:cytidine kinase